MIDADVNSLLSFIKIFHDPYSIIMHTPASINKAKQRFLIKKADKLISISVDKIVCFYSRNRVNFMLSTDQRSYIVDNTMEQLEKNLDPDEFFRINRSCIISYQCIQEVSMFSNSRLKVKLLNSDEDYFVAKDRVSDFKKWIGGN